MLDYSCLFRRDRKMFVYMRKKIIPPKSFSLSHFLRIFRKMKFKISQKLNFLLLFFFVDSQFNMSNCFSSPWRKTDDGKLARDQCVHRTNNKTREKTESKVFVLCDFYDYFAIPRVKLFSGVVVVVSMSVINALKRINLVRLQFFSVFFCLDLPLCLSFVFCSIKL